MVIPRFFSPILLRNLLGLLALVGVHLLLDWPHLTRRSGLGVVSPYFFLVLLYAWLVFHNRVLFGQFFLKGQRMTYTVWTLLLMAIGSFNLNFVLKTEFDVSRTLPYIVNYWLYTIVGLGVYVIFLYLRQRPNERPETAVAAPTAAGTFVYQLDGMTRQVPYSDILYIESLQNYLKINTVSQSFIIRSTMKEAEQRLPKSLFIRISKFHIVNRLRLNQTGPDNVLIGSDQLKVGRTYKKYVMEQLNPMSL